MELLAVEQQEQFSSSHLVALSQLCTTSQVQVGRALTRQEHHWCRRQMGAFTGLPESEELASLVLVRFTTYL